MNYLKKIKKASSYIIKKIKCDKIDVAVIFGSGLSPSNELLNGIEIDYDKIPFFPNPTIKGHIGKLIYSVINKKNVLTFLGRLHYYEGYTPLEVTFPIRIIKELGARILILTNACGAIDRSFKAGEMMIIHDQINLTGVNPLIGQNIDEHGVRFVDMTQPFSFKLIKQLKKISKIKLKEGIYIGVSGPTYETKAEIKFYRTIGANVVGMSTVLEAIVANHCGIDTLGISCVVNSSLDRLEGQVINHEKVISVASQISKKLFQLILDFIRQLNLNE